MHFASKLFPKLILKSRFLQAKSDQIYTSFKESSFFSIVDIWVKETWP